MSHRPSQTTAFWHLLLNLYSGLISKLLPAEKAAVHKQAKEKNMAYLQSVIYHWLLTQEKWIRPFRFTLLRLKWPIWPNVVQPVAKAVQIWIWTGLQVHDITCMTQHIHSSEWGQITVYVTCIGCAVGLCIDLEVLVRLQLLCSWAAIAVYLFFCQTAVRDKEDRLDICAYFSRGCFGGGGGSPSWLCGGFLVTCL